LPSTARSSSIKSKEEKTVTITKDMAIGEVVEQYPETVPVFLQHGLGCFGCALARFENIEQGAMAHGIDINVLMKALNEAVAAPVDS
jgi:hybrid cluster-associated redox disulfide protein